jgi:hypothetical protein
LRRVTHFELKITILGHARQPAVVNEPVVEFTNRIIINKCLSLLAKNVSRLEFDVEEKATDTCRLRIQRYILNYSNAMVPERPVNNSNTKSLPRDLTGVGAELVKVSVVILAVNVLIIKPGRLKISNAIVRRNEN